MHTAAGSSPPQLGPDLVPARRRAIRTETLGFTILLGLLGALPPLSIDVSAPTLLVVQAETRADSGLIALVITLFMLGFAVGQFAAGPLSDRYGRRPLLVGGLVCYTLAAVFCATSGSAEALIAWRFAQGAGAGACVVLVFAVIRDLFEGDQARAKRSYIAVVFGIAPMLAPLLGAWIMDHGGWRTVYLCLALGGLGLLVIVVFGVAESRKPLPHVGPAPGSVLLTAYRAVLSDRAFTRLVATNGLSFGAVFAYIAASPLVLMGSFGLSPAGYGQMFACTAGSMALGAWISGRCANRRVPSAVMLWVGFGGCAASAVALAILLTTPAPTIPTILAPLMLHLLFRGLTAPNIQHVALEPMLARAGTAAAALGVIQILSGVASSALIAVLFPLIGAPAMGLVMAVLAMLALGLWAIDRRLTAPA